MSGLFNYFAHLKTAKLVLWNYLIWYGVTVYFHFDASPKIWINALGISLVIGVALILSVGNGFSLRINPWQTFRLFWMPFAVSSFSSLIKGQGFFVIFSPDKWGLVIAIASCLIFSGGVFLLGKIAKKN